MNGVWEISCVYLSSCVFEKEGGQIGGCKGRKVERAWTVYGRVKERPDLRGGWRTHDRIPTHQHYSKYSENSYYT